MYQMTIAMAKTQERTRGTAARAKRVIACGCFAAAMLVAGLAPAPPAYASTTFTVNLTSDEGDTHRGDGVCEVGPGTAGFCTLRAAIEESNATPGADAIKFNISGDNGVKTIFPSSSLPLITDTVTIDGYTQPGASPNTLTKGTNAVLKIELNGSGAGSTVGLQIDAPNSVVRGLVIDRFAGCPGCDGILVRDHGGGSKIEGNFIGTDSGGTLDRGNADEAVDVGASGVTVGGTSPAARNLLSGNDGSGVESFTTTGVKVFGNLIGTKKDGTTALGNRFEGVEFLSVSKSLIGNESSGGANIIAFNGGSGVLVRGGVIGPNDANGNRVLSNSIFSNAGLGIDLSLAFGGDGPTANDPDDNDDEDAGPNGLQNKPVLSSAKTFPNKTTVTGKLNSTPGKTFKIQFFSNPSGTDEGKRFLGQKRVSTDASGNVSLTKALPKVAVGQTVTATAIGPGGNTSEFSAARKVAAS